MKVFRIDSPVKIGDDVSAVVIGIAIYSTRIQYQVVWWSGRERKCEWLQESEVKSTVKNRSTQIGFVA